MKEYTLLVLSRRPGERIRLKTASGEIIWIEVAGIDRQGAIRLAFSAPQSVEIMREELLTIKENHHVQ